MTRYAEHECLLLSGLQHYAFCKRQWALIHIEQQWAENYRTVDGMLMHKNAHDRTHNETRKDLLIIRAMAVSSQILGISGECDVVEFSKDPNGISLHGREGLWMPFPVEYKRGKPRAHDADILQLCAQAMCLEEMLLCDIPKGALYYGEIRSREVVLFTQDIRDTVRAYLTQMHELYRRGHTPKVKPTKECNACSLKELCLPKLMKTKSVTKYIADHVGGDP